jgi:type III restriction enzyme
MSTGAPDLFPLATALSGRLGEVELALVSGLETDALDAFTPTTQSLLPYWFSDDYCAVRTLNFHEGQRRAILAVIYAHEVIQAPTLQALYEDLAPEALLAAGAMEKVSGRHQQHPKYAAKMATGTGKTWVLNALLIWQYLNHLHAPDDHRFTSNFLVVAPGLIVYDRLLDSFLGKEIEGERDFRSSDVFQTQDLFIPDDHRHAVFGFLQSSVVVKEDIGRKVTAGGQIVITNWHLLAGEEDPDFLADLELPGAEIDAKAAVESFFPVTPGTSAGNELARLDRGFLKGGPLRALTALPDLMVFNDEAHHVHEIKRGGEVTEVEWQASLTEIASTKGARFVQVDFSATPFNEVGGGKKKRLDYFPHIVVDFDLNAAMSAGLVKSLALDRRKGIGALADLDFRAERDERDIVVGLSEGQKTMLRAGLAKQKILEDQFTGVDLEKRPKLMVICEDTTVTPFVVEFLKECGLGEDDILRIDSTRKGELSKDEWAVTRERLFDLDRHAQPKVIVSVLMLREGFDVNNICVIVPLRSSEARTLLEQTIGRGLRLMWRGNDEIDEAKRETRERFRKGLEPENFFDVLFIVEHPAFAEFYRELIEGGLAGEVGDDSDDTDPTGDIEVVGLRDGWEEFDFAVPFVIQEADEELVAPLIDPLSLEKSGMSLEVLKKAVGRGDQFISEEAQHGTQFGDYRVEGGVMTATGYNDYLGRMTRRIAEALSADVTKSSKKYREVSRYPFLQVNLPQLTGWIDAYVRQQLFEGPFDPMEDENWRVLLVEYTANHIAGVFATALIEAESNAVVGESQVLYRRISEVASITVRTSTCQEVKKCIYPALPVLRHSGGFERDFMQWADKDGLIQAFVKIQEHKHSFMRRRYLKSNGMPANYWPDFLVRTAERVYLVETKRQSDMVNEDVLRKARAAKAWCDQINTLAPEDRGDKEWHYVLLGEDVARTHYKLGQRLSEILDFAKSPTDAQGQQSLL